MHTVPVTLTRLIVKFAPVFSKRVWEHVQVLVVGALLAPGQRTVTAVLRVMGLSQERHFQNYYRALNRTRWSTLATARVLLELVVHSFAPTGVVAIGLDDTLEWRRGAKIKAKGIYHAPVCSHMVKASGQRVMASISGFITRRLKLKVNADESAVGRPWERKFLGFRLSAERPPRRKIAPQSVERFKHRVREITRRARGVSLDRVVADLRPYLRGWGEYFGWCETPSRLEDLDKWIRRKLRCYLWTQWRTRERRRLCLRARGLNPKLAAQGALFRGL